MTARFEYYITGDDVGLMTYGDLIRFQTFTPTVSHRITSIKLKLYRVGSPGTALPITIRTTSSGKPTDTILASGTTDGNTLTTSSAGEWREITLGAGFTLDSGTMYALLISAPAGDTDNAVRVRADTSSPTYTVGTAGDSDDGGTTWNIRAGIDNMFEEWGSTSGLPTVTTQATTDIVTTTATGNGNITDLGDTSVTEHGHCWNTTGNPTTSDSKTTNGSAAAIGAFTSRLTGLTSSTLYYVKAYATNTAGTSYGQEVTFTAGALEGGELAGVYAVVEERFHYVDAYGVERYIQGEPVV